MKDTQLHQPDYCLQISLEQTAVRAESFNYLSTLIVICLLQRCLQTIVRLVSLSVLHFNIFSIIVIKSFTIITHLSQQLFASKLETDILPVVGNPLLIPELNIVYDIQGLECWGGWDVHFVQGLCYVIMSYGHCM